MKPRLTINVLSNCYGVTESTIRAWKRRTGLTIADFRDPQKVCDHLVATATNRTPRLELLRMPGICELISQRIEIFLSNFLQ
jgi:hypothetical protein